MTSYSRIFNQSIHKTEAELTRQVRSLASRSGWPEVIASSLHVKFRDEAFHVEYPEIYAHTVNMLETGTQDSPPNAVLRRFENAVTRKGGAVLMHYVGETINKARVFS